MCSVSAIEKVAGEGGKRRRKSDRARLKIDISMAIRLVRFSGKRIQISRYSSYPPERIFNFIRELEFSPPVRIFEGRAVLKTSPILVVVLDPDGVDVNINDSAMKIYLSKNILSQGTRLLGMTKILRTGPEKNPYRWV